MYLSRTAKIRSGTKIYHISLRGINRQTIFEEEEDITMFLLVLKKIKAKSGYIIFGYCIMGNHIQLLIKEGDEELGIFRGNGSCVSLTLFCRKQENRQRYLIQEKINIVKKVAF